MGLNGMLFVIDVVLSSMLFIHLFGNIFVHCCLKLLFLLLFSAVKYVAKLEDGTVVLKSDGVEFTVEGDAFGENGRPASGDEGAVPWNASLQIDLELVSWKAVSDITKDKKVLKKTLKEGEGYECPNDGAVVQDGTVFVKKGHDDEQPFEFKIDEEQVIDGLDKAVMNMKKAEVALVTIHPEYAFGSSGSTQKSTLVQSILK
ncbi:hypothetical protein Ahy_A05g022917 [Arachis hypogaea]|uniref:peptidylprolyl isomerase n=1 Tax=Arachis hypogaea TaxID=3818 RepID=A0A445D1X8_ARAHY|nr:hypothetical protein Ahy_A05g022917 [Arachis hypogaea]